MSFDSIVMPYKENCKKEGETLTKFKIARMFFADNARQNQIAKHLNCHKNTINKIIKTCREHGENNAEIWLYLKTKKHISVEVLDKTFKFLKHKSRKPNSNKRSLKEEEERVILEKHKQLNYGSKRMFNYLKRIGLDTKVYTFSKIKGVYKRNGLKVKKVRTANGNRRPLYDYEKIEAFEYLQYDTKEILDKKALPKEIYDKFKNTDELPIYQWTIIDAKTKTRFLAWSYTRSSFYGFKFLKYVVFWLRSHNVRTKINVQIDGGSEFCSASKRKLKNWNDKFEKYDVEVCDTEGSKWKQNLVERSHKIDDEEFYCPRGGFIGTKSEFVSEGQNWIIYYNNRASSAIGLTGLSPKEKLEQLGFYNADHICNFPILILDDWFVELRDFCGKSQNVLEYYPNTRLIH